MTAELAGLVPPARPLVTVPLTFREKQVAHFASMGYSAKYIASLFTISSRTVEAHLAHIYQKTGVRSRDAFIDHTRGTRA